MSTRHGIVRGALAVTCAGIVANAACAQQPVAVPLRSLERSGRIAFLCVDAAAGEVDGGVAPSPGRPMDDCTGYTADVADYSIHHVLGLVTQTSRGEVAVVDLTSATVVDSDPSMPGFNFLPIGAAPGAIVSTPGSTMTFVGAAEPNRTGIYAIPTELVRGASPSLASWPACSLPVAPGAMVVVVDRAPDASSPASARASCAAAPGTAATDGSLDHGLSGEARPAGRRKLVVALPELGSVAVVDAHALASRPGGSFDPCPVERIVELSSDLPATLPPEVLPPGTPIDPAGPAPATPAPLTVAKPHPSALALADDGRIFVADDAVPLVHVLDASDPCAIRESAPFYPQSADDPRRTVVTSSVAVSPLTHDGKRYAYAVDQLEGSILIFDASVDSTTRAPLVHPHAADDPFEPRDRIAFGSPVRAITFAYHEVQTVSDDAGVASGGVLCDPTRGASLPDSPGVSYRTATDYLSGAAPRTIRGTFAFAALASGQVVTIDVDDLDAPCRRPVGDDAALGCAGTNASYGDPSDPSTWTVSAEQSCRVVERHRARSGYFYVDNPDQPGAGLYLPAMSTAALLSSETGALLTTDLSDDGTKHPKLLGPAGSPKPRIGASTSNGDGGTLDLQYAPGVADKNWVSFDLREPRVHYEQDWSITYEGVLVGFASRLGSLQCVDPFGQPLSSCSSTKLGLYDSTALFCDRGVHDRAATSSALSAAGLAPRACDAAAGGSPKPFADVAEITSELPDPSDPYWSAPATSCAYEICREAFGTAAEPRVGAPGELSPRDLLIDEAYQDHLVVSTADGCNAPTKTPSLLGCCFPTQVTYRVRAQAQWTVVGSTIGFAHHVVTTSTSDGARCVDSTDPLVALRTSRVFESDAKSKALPFANAQMRFVVWAGSEPSARDWSFGLHETRGFAPLAVALGGASAQVAPQSIEFVRPLAQLVVPDGASQGVEVIDVSTVTLVRTLY